MYPHQNNIRDRRGAQPPLAPQHVLGMQQSPGVIMSLPNQQMQIMAGRQHHYSNHNTYSGSHPRGPGASFAPHGSSQHHPHPPHHQGYHHQSYRPQMLHKQAMNHKPFRRDYTSSKVHHQHQYGGGENTYNSNSSHPHTTTHSYHPHTINGQVRSQTMASSSTSGSTMSHAPGSPLAPSSPRPVTSPRPSSPPPSSPLRPSSPPAQSTPSPPRPNTPPTLSSRHSDKEESPSAPSSPQPAVDVDECAALPAALIASMKEKTPMCLINELARFNKVTHQYRLTDEQGPAHQKSFTVMLTLGTEEYVAQGPSIKKAQHSAAGEALSKTSFPHPTPKTNKNIHIAKSNITPTVELNALAMKRGEPAVYKLLEPPQAPLMYQPQQSFTFRRPYGIRGGFAKRARGMPPFRNGRIPSKPPAFPHNVLYTVSLKVGSWEFFGEGSSPQSARHDAAAKALAQLKQLPMPEESMCPAVKEEVNVTTAETAEAGIGMSSAEADLESTIKSPISLVHEVALKRSMNVMFHVVSEKGPPHMKTFVTKCVVGELTALGEGSGKKVSKKRAAENMLMELKKLPPLSPVLMMTALSQSKLKKKTAQPKKKSRNLIKIVQPEQKSEPEAGDDMNPISRLIQIQQGKKEKEPWYALVEEKGMPRRREFVMEVTVGQLKAQGSGPNKKLAKKVAAQNMLAIMGFAMPEPVAIKPMAKSLAKPMGAKDAGQDGKNKKVALGDGDKNDSNQTSTGQGGPSGRQLVPGLLLMSEQQNYGKSPMTGQMNIQTTASIAKERLVGANSPTTDAITQKITNSSPNTKLPPVSPAFSPKEQLLYLADLLHFQVQFSDFPKGNHSEFLSLVSLSTDPPQVCHGSGPSVGESHDQAALTALRALSEMGLDSVAQTSNDSSLGKTSKPMGSLKK